VGGRRGAGDAGRSDDPQPEVDAEALRLLLREIFAAAGGTHDDWADMTASCASSAARRADHADPVYGN